VHIRKCHDAGRNPELKLRAADFFCHAPVFAAPSLIDAALPPPVSRREFAVRRVLKTI
jgi:hypothetical protein